MQHTYFRFVGVIISCLVLLGCQKAPPSEQAAASATPGGVRCTLSEDNVLEIQGNGVVKMEDFPFFPIVGTNLDIAASIEKVIIHEGITEIGRDCLSGFSSLQTLELPKSLKKIHAIGFADDYELEHLVIPDTVEELGSYSFESCCSLEEVVLPASLKKYKANVFNGCYSLKRMVNHSGRTWPLPSKGMYGTWYYHGKKVDEIKPGQEVQFQLKQFKINYNLNGGTATGELSPRYYTYRDRIDLPVTVERKGYSFLGWILDHTDDCELSDYIDSETKGDQEAVAAWIDFRLKKGKPGEVRANWKLDLFPETPDHYTYLCEIRYSKNPDMSDCVYVETTDNEDTDAVIDKLESGQRYYFEYAVIEDMDDYWDLEDFPWQGKRSILVS